MFCALGLLNASQNRAKATLRSQVEWDFIQKKFVHTISPLIFKGLYQEVIVQLDNKVNYREKKSPNKLPEQENLTNAQKRLSAVEPNQKK